MTTLPRTDLSKLQQEVLSGPPEAALPSQLSDCWLELIARDLEMTVGDGEPEEGGGTYASAPLALITHLLFGKRAGKEFALSYDEIYSLFCDLRVEISLEIVSRQTDIKVEPATLETIFSNREVSIEKK
jgi:hypothetical protein